MYRIDFGRPWKRQRLDESNISREATRVPRASFNFPQAETLSLNIPPPFLRILSAKRFTSADLRALNAWRSFESLGNLEKSKRQKKKERRKRTSESLLVLTDKDVTHQRGRQAEDDDKDVGDREIDDEEVRDGPHPRRPIHHGYDETVADQADDEYQNVCDTVNRGHRHAVPVQSIGNLFASGEVHRFTGVQQSTVLLHRRPRVRRDRLRYQVVQIIAKVVPHLQEGASGRWNGRDGGRRHVAIVTPAAGVDVELLGVWQTQ